MDDATRPSNPAPGCGGKDAKAPAGVSGQKSDSPSRSSNKPTNTPRRKITVRGEVIPALMKMAIAPNESIDALTIRDYRDDVMREMGNPVDALERMLIEQASVAHVMVMHMHSQTTLAKTAEVAGVYAGAAARLMSELRRTILSVREYRAPMTRPVVTTIEQQNIAHTQAVSYAASTAASQDVVMACRDKISGDGELENEVEHEQGEIDEIFGGRIGTAAALGTRT